MTTARRIWGWLGTPAAARMIALLMVVYLGALGALTYGQNRIVSCQAKYAEASARATQARAQLAAQDRQLDLQERALDERDRQTAARSEAAWDAVLAALAADDDQRLEATFADLIRVRGDVARDRAETASQRQQIAATRADNEEERRRNPVPDPPSTAC